MVTDDRASASKKSAQRKELVDKKLTKSKQGVAANAAPVGDPKAVRRNLEQLSADLEALASRQASVETALSEGAGKTQDVSDFNAIRDDAERYEQARKFTEALRKVAPLYADYRTLRTTLGHACKAAEDGRVQARQPLDARPPGEWAQLVKLGQQVTVRVNQTQARLFSQGLPEGYTKQVDGEWDKRLIERLKPFVQGKDAVENGQLRQAVRDNAPTPAETQRAEALGKELNEGRQKYEVRGLNNASVFFDAGRNGVAMSPEDKKKSYEANAALVEMGCNILNSGGTYAQVQKLMKAAGVPDEAWPPQLVQSVQAWRKTQHALVEERVQALFKKPKKGFESPVERETLDAVSAMFTGTTELAEALREITDQAEEAAKAAEEAANAADSATTTASSTSSAIGDAASSAADSASSAAQSASEATKAITAAAWVNGIGSGLDGILGLVQIVQGAKEFFEVASAGEFPDKEGMLKLLDASLETLGGMVRVAKDGMQMAKDFGGDALHKEMAKVLPGLGIAVAAIELAKSTKELGEDLDSLNKASALKRDALASFARDDGDEAAVNVFANDKSGARTRVAKSSVEVGANTAELAGAIATTAGGAHGAAAGAALSIAAGVVKVGSKVVFAGIDWSKAKKAMAKIREAQAGNYQAQVEVFEDSNFYAKMYLAILVKEGNPMAEKYLVNQGLEEGDLEGPTGLAILRDGMLEAAKQSNDLEADETLFGKAMEAGGKLVEGIKGLTAADVAEGALTFVIAGGVLAPVTLTVVDFARKAVTPNYDENANYTPRGFNAEDVAGWPDTWSNAKRLHVDNGLINDAEGLDSALKKAVSASVAAPSDAAIAKGLDAKAMNEGAAATLKAIAAINAVVALSESVQLQAYLPGATMPTKCPHKQGYASLKSLHSASTTAVENLWLRYDKLKPPGRKLWVPPVIQDIKVASWTGFWQAGQASVGFPAGDGGVEKAIAVSETALKDFGNEKEGKKKRQLALAYIESLDDVNDAVVEARGLAEVNRCEPAVKALDAFMLVLNKARRELDEQIASGQGGVLPPWTHPATNFGAIKPTEYLGKWTAVWDYAVKGGFSVGSSDAGLTDALKQFQAAVDDWEKANADADSKGMLKATRAMEVCAGRVKKHAIEFGRKQRYASDPLKTFVEGLRKAVVALSDKVVSSSEADANAVDFNNTPAKPPLYLSSFDWRRVCDEAVAKGAVLESSTASKTLAKALKELKNERLAYEKNLKAKEKGSQMRKVADAYVKAMEGTATAVEMTRGLKRYDKNTRMAAYLDGIAKAVEEARKDETLGKFIDGSASLGNASFGTPDLTTSTWHKNKKLAVENGVIPAKSTKVHDALEAFMKVVDGSDAAKKKENRDDLLDWLNVSKASSKNPKWGTYIDGMAALVKAR